MDRVSCFVLALCVVVSVAPAVMIGSRNQGRRAPRAPVRARSDAKKTAPSGTAGTVVPALFFNYSGSPQLRVIAGQRFQVERSVQYTNAYFFVSQSDWLLHFVELTRSSALAYVRGAPAAYNVSLWNTPWQQYSRERTTNAVNSSYVSSVLYPGNASYIARPSTFLPKWRLSTLKPNDTVLQVGGNGARPR